LGWPSKAEKEGRPPGTSEVLMTETTEKPIKMASPPLSPVSVDSIKGLVQLAELLLAPADVRNAIAELEKAVSDSREVVEQTKAAQRDLAKLRKDLESERAKHEVTLNRERAELESAMARERLEVEAIKNAALELKAKAEADAAAAKWIKDELMRRVSPFSPVEGS
jgi:biopolymer transport protein ExbB/TolQ